MDTKEKKGTARPRSTGTKQSQTSTGTRRRTTQQAASQTKRPAAAKETQKRTQSAAGTQTARKRTTVQPQPKAEPVPTPDVVYTPAKPFSRNRFLLRLATVVAIVVAMVFGISLFFKVETVTVSGANKYTPYMVQVASGIQEGDNLLTLSDARISGKIIAALPYVEDVRISIQLPDTVNIEITEMDVVYSIKDDQDAWWLITSDGRVVVQADNATAGTHTKILGVALQAPSSGQQARAGDVVLTLEDETQTSQSMSGDSRLSAALSIVQYLESGGIIGEVASVDVTDLADIELWYGQRYQVKLGDTTELGYKIRIMNAAINGENGLEEYDSGILEILLDGETDVRYKPFE